MQHPTVSVRRQYKLLSLNRSGLWRRVKSEEVYLKEYATLAEAEAGLAAYCRFYDERRRHRALGYPTPGQVHFALARLPVVTSVKWNGC